MARKRVTKRTDQEIMNWIRKQPPAPPSRMVKGCKADDMGTTWGRFTRLYGQVMSGVELPARAAPGTTQPAVERVVDPEVVLQQGLSQALRDVLAFMCMGESLHCLGSPSDPDATMWVSHDHGLWPKVASKLPVTADTIRTLLALDAVQLTHSWDSPVATAYGITDIGWDLQEETPGDVEQYSSTSSSD